MVTLNLLSRLEESVVKAKSLIFEWFDSDEEKAEYWVRISAMCCHLNELTAYKCALYKENLKP